MRTAPSTINIMLHHYYSPEPYPEPSGVYDEIIKGLISEGLIKPDEAGTYRTTKRGSAWVEMICAVPYPVEETVFVDPRDGRIIK